MKPKLSELVATFAWISTFVAGWMIFLRFVKADGLSWMLFAFFLIAAIMASAMTMERNRRA